MKKTLTIILAILISLTLGITTGLLVAIAMPNDWFGSCFEGSCGYAALLVGILFGLLLAMIGFIIWLFIWIDKNKYAEEIKRESDEKAPEIAMLWIVLSLLSISAVFINVGMNISIYFIALSSILFIICSAILAYKSKLNPLIVLIIFIPYIGFFILCIILIPKIWWHLSKPEQDSIH
jgi:hypothetical protein